MVTVRGDLDPDVPPFLHPGPEVDGRPTWLCHYEDVPDGYELRHQADAAFVARADRRWPPLAGDETRWVQVRRRLPQPADYVLLADGVSDQPLADMGDLVGEFRYRKVTFGQVCEAVVGAMPERDLLAGEDYAEPEHSVAVAVWHLLTG